MTITCRKCKREIFVSATLEQIEAWHGGLLIQQAMPNIPAGQLEMFLTRICDTCFNRAFNDC